MRVYEICQGKTGPQALRMVNREEPEPGAGQVLVRMRAASLNFRDLAILNGKYIGGPLQRDTVPLSDGAGEVVAVGAGVESLRVGDRVVATFTQGRRDEALGSPLDGVLREYAVFDADGVLPFPAHLDYETAATLPCAGVTAWNALFEGKPLRPGETVLTLGTGGVSIYALQLARLAGARVIITSSSDEKLARATQLGAGETINYRRVPDWEAEVLRMTGGAGVDHLIETAAPATLPRSYQAVARHGEIALIGVLTRPDGDPTPYPIMIKRATLRGIFVGGREHLEALIRAVAVNEMVPVVDRVFDFEAAPEAYACLKSARHFGKVVVRI